MPILDLRWTLFVVLMLPVAAALLTAATLYLRERQQRTQRRINALRPLLDRAPTGVLLLDQAKPGRERLRYANAQARHLLDLANAPPTSKFSACPPPQRVRQMAQPTA